MLSFKPRLAIAALFVTLLTISDGCGYVSSGEWTDDKSNWTHAFGEPIPDGVTVVNSWCMRTSHFTAEYAWFFKLQLDANTRKLIESDLDSKKLTSAEAVRAVKQTYSNRPIWFPMDDLDRYDIYQSQSQPNFLMLIERDGSSSFWTSWQL